MNKLAGLSVLRSPLLLMARLMLINLKEVITFKIQMQTHSRGGEQKIELIKVGVTIGETLKHRTYAGGRREGDRMTGR